LAERNSNFKLKIMLFFPDVERMSFQEITKFQEIKLQETLLFLQSRSVFYQRLFEESRLNIENIRTLADLRHIRPTEKSDLQNFNKEFICVPKEQVIDYVTTSGTLSDPVTFGMSDKDLDRLAYNEAISFSCAGGHPGEVYQLMTTIDKRFMAGLAYFLGIRKLGAGIIRVGNGIPELQWDSINRFCPDAIIVVPSFILKIIQYAEDNNIDYRNSSIKKAICIGENLREQNFSLNMLGQRIKEKWDIQLFSTYASTEMSTTFTECSYGQGGHHHPELIIAELLNENDEPVEEGEYGELTITTLGVEAMPLLRFKTGDICRFHYEPCKCGRNTMRISPIMGRRKQMIKYKGTTLYPSSIFDVLENIDFVENYIVEVSSNELDTDEILVWVGSMDPTENNMKIIKDHFRAKLRVCPQVQFKKIEEISKIQMPESTRKPIKLIDRRNILA
jgi:phenylacetate-CoA ligase